MDLNVNEIEKWLRSEQEKNTAKHINILSRSAVHGRTEVCQLILDYGAVDSEALLVALRFACRYGHLPVAQLLVSKLGHLANYTEMLIDTLTEAATPGQTEVVQWLLDIILLPDIDSKRWLLVTASGRGDLSTVGRLVGEIGADDVTVMSHALRIACFNGRRDVVEWLLAHTAADVGKTGKVWAGRGELSSLAAACMRVQKHVVGTLLQYTPESSLSDMVNLATDIRRTTALHLTIWCNTNCFRDELHRACDEGDTDTVEKLLCDTSRINAQDGRGLTPLHYACMTGNLLVVQLLLSMFAATEVADNDTLTPIKACTAYGNDNLVPYLQCLLDFEATQIENTKQHHSESVPTTIPADCNSISKDCNAFKN